MVALYGLPFFCTNPLLWNNKNCCSLYANNVNVLLLDLFQFCFSKRSHLVKVPKENQLSVFPISSILFYATRLQVSSYLVPIEFKNLYFNEILALKCFNTFSLKGNPFTIDDPKKCCINIEKKICYQIIIIIIIHDYVENICLFPFNLASCKK